MCTHEGLEEVRKKLEKGNGTINEDELINYLIKNETVKYNGAKELREALRQFDFDNDGKIKFEEFKYFMESFGETENEIHMNEERLNTLCHLCPLDAQGNIEIDRLVHTLTAEWSLYT